MTYETLATEEEIKKASDALVANGFHAEVVATRQEALEKIKSLIPSGASVMNGSSITLEEIGYMEYLKSGKHSWVNLHAQVNAENDRQKRTEFRKKAALSDYYLGSVHALTEDGQMIIASNTGSQLPHLAYTSKNLILVVGTQKIVSS